jgi:hypothetical protein
LTIGRPVHIQAMRSISSTSAPNILNQLPEPHPKPEHPPRTNEGLRVCQVIGLKPERIEEYEKVHREVWPGVLNALRRANVVGERRIRNSFTCRLADEIMFVHASGDQTTRSITCNSR